MNHSTSWELSEKWYDALVGEKGHYYHKHIVIPNVLRLLDLDETSSLLDLACGQGVLARAIPKVAFYQGIDISTSFIQKAKGITKSKFHRFSVGDICKNLPIEEKSFSHATIVLALQNMASPKDALKQASKHLKKGATLLIVLNHPCFRIPRQSHWGVDEKQKLQYRRVDKYMTPLKIPIQTHPGKGSASETTWTFHHPLSDFSRWLMDTGFVITLLEEWVSDKTSTGKNAKMENIARSEFPLFLAIKTTKL